MFRPLVIRSLGSQVLNLAHWARAPVSAQIKPANGGLWWWGGERLWQHVAQQLKLLAAEQAQLRSSLPGSRGAPAAVCLSLPISLLLCSLRGLLLLV